MKICVLEQQVKHPGRNSRDAVQDNLKLYEETAKFAKEKGCGMLICPEFGLIAGVLPQDRLSFGEPLPALGQLPNVSLQPTLWRLSCIANESQVFLVVSLIEKADAFYNTTVILDPDGGLRGRHRKKHLYMEPGLTASKEESQVFDIGGGFGKIEFLTCFDILLGVGNRNRRSSDLTIMLSHWYDETPNLTLLSTVRSWAISNKKSIVVSNCRCVRQGTLGCGIFHPNGNGQYSMSFSKDEELVHIFDTDDDTVLTRDPRDVTVPDIYQPITTDLSRFDRLPLLQQKGCLRLNLATISCQITYELRSPPTPESFYIMAASDGLRIFGNGDRLYLQELFVFAMKKSTTGRQVSITAGTPFRALKMVMTINVDCENVREYPAFPFVVGNNLSLVDNKHYHFDSDTLELDVDGAVVCAGFCRRIFHKDYLRPSRKRSHTL